MLDPDAWVRVGDYLVAPDYIAPVGIGEAINLAEEHGCILPTPELVNKIWAAADLRLEPQPRTFELWTMAEMNAPAVIGDQARRIAEAIGGRRYRLLAGTHKDVVMRNGRVGLYGWHRLNGAVIQPFFTGHALSWKDYSQGLRLVKEA